MAITVHPTSDSEINSFIKLQWKFYRDDRNWVPPLHFDRRKLLNKKKNPFFQHAEMQLFLAEEDGVPVGRIAAITNQRHNDVHEDKVGFFGFFECIDKQKVANALFDAVAEWLRGKGKDTMRGPMNPSVNDEIGMLIRGFDSPPVILMTYNPPYYPTLCDDYGFEKAKDLYAYLLETEKVLTEKLERGQKLVRDRYGLTIRNVDFKNLKQEVVTLKHIYNQAWEKNWGAVAATDAEFDTLAADLSQVVANFKEFVFVAEVNGKPIGFALCLPDINQLLISNKRGWLLPGAWKLMTGTKTIDLLRIIVLGVLPQYRGKGFDAVMYWEIVTRARDRGIFKGEASWVLEDNTMMNHGAKLMNAEAYKTYRIYDKKLG